MAVALATTLAALVAAIDVNSPLFDGPASSTSLQPAATSAGGRFPERARGGWYPRMMRPDLEDDGDVDEGATSMPDDEAVQFDVPPLRTKAPPLPSRTTSTRERAPSPTQSQQTALKRTADTVARIADDITSYNGEEGKTMAQRVLLHTDNGARCLDGSPAAIYISKGAETRRWLVFHEGGQWCTMAGNDPRGVPGDDCCYRATTVWGSSKFMPNVTDLASSYGSYLSRDPMTNPHMHNWSFAMLGYCDGGSFAGAAKEPLRGACTGDDRHEGADELFFAGAFIRDEAMRYMKAEHNLGNAQQVIIGGCSSGGLSAMLHADKWVEALPNVPRVVAMSDSGFDLDLRPRLRRTHFNRVFKFVFDTMNAQDGVDESCIAHYKSSDAGEHQGMLWRCMHPEHVLPHVTTPTMIIQSIFDQYTNPRLAHEYFVDYFDYQQGAASQELYDRYEGPVNKKNHTTVHTKHSLAMINEDGQAMRTVIKQILNTQPQHTAFLDSCERHCTTSFVTGKKCSWDRISSVGGRPADTLARFSRQEQRPSQQLQEQGAPFPCPRCCGGQAAGTLSFAAAALARAKNHTASLNPAAIAAVAGAMGGLLDAVNKSSEHSFVSNASTLPAAAAAVAAAVAGLEAA